MNKLIKLTNDHYVVVNDSEIKMDDWYLDDTNTVRQAITEAESYWTHRKHYKKVTHSTQPLESIVTENSFKTYEFISLQEVKELIGEVDVEKKAREEVERYMISTSSIDLKAKIQRFQGYMKGYNQALEDNKEKKYTEKELIWAIQEAYGHGQDDEFDGIFHLAESIEVITKSLQLKTSWEIELETIDNRQPCHCQCHNNIDMVHFVACCNDGWIGKITQKLKLK